MNPAWRGTFSTLSIIFNTSGDSLHTPLQVCDAYRCPAEKVIRKVNVCRFPSSEIPCVETTNLSSAVTISSSPHPSDKTCQVFKPGIFCSEIVHELEYLVLAQV